MKKQVKKIVSLILAATILFSFAAIGISASAAMVPGALYICTGDGLTGYGYTLLDDGEIEVEPYNYLEEDFIVPEIIDGYPVTKVVFSDDAICGNVYIPASVKLIEGNTVEKFIVDKSNPNYFSDENGVLFDKNVETLVAYPAGRNTKDYSVPSSVKHIGENAFNFVVFLENLVLNEGLVDIGIYAFKNSMSLKTVSIPSTVTNIHNSAFYECNALEFIDVDDNNAYYSNDENGILFNKDKTKLYKFPACCPLESYVIPDSVEQVVFEWYGPTLRAFDNFKYLKEITVPASMSMLSKYGFSDFEKIYASPNHPLYKSVDGVLYSKDGTEIVRYPGASKVTCFRYPDEVISKEYDYGKGEMKYLASVVYNNALSENVTPVENGEEFSSYELATLTDVYHMGDGEPFERTARNTYYDREVTYHYNCKPDDHFHDYDFEITSAPTCGKDGVATLTCSCGKVITTEIENDGFHEIEDSFQKYTQSWCRCKSIEYDMLVCKNCNNYGLAKVLSIPEMNMITKYNYATDTEEGLNWSVCADCGVELNNSFISIGNKTITVRINGIDVVEDYAPGETIRVKYEPKKKNAEFVGWADESGNIVELPETMPDKDVKYTAVFRTVLTGEAGITATFDEDCFSNVSDISKVQLEVVDLGVDNDNVSGGEFIIKDENGKSYERIGFYDIKMTYEGSPVKFNEGKTVKIKLPVTGNEFVKQFVVIHRFTGGGRENFYIDNPSEKYENGYLTIEVGKFSEFEVYALTDKEPVTPGIKLVSAPSKTKYTYKTESMDLSGIAVEITKADGTKETVTDTSKMKVVGFDNTKIGTQTVTVECEGQIVQFEVSVSYAWWQWIIRILFLGFLWY